MYLNEIETTSLPRILVFEDMKNVFEDFKIFLSSSIEVDHIVVPDPGNYTELIEIFAPIFFSQHDGYLIDIDLYHYNLLFAQINNIGIRNGRDIAKLILEYNNNLIVANYSANQNFDTHNIPYIHKDKKPFEIILKPFIDVVNKAKSLIKLTLSIEEFYDILRKQDKIDYIKEVFSGRNPNLYFSFYGCAWYIEYQGVIIQNGPDISSKLVDLLPTRDFHQSNENEAIRDDSTILIGMEEVPLVFWNFRNLESLEFIFSNYYDRSYKNENGFLGIMFNLQASKKLAQVTAQELISIGKIKKMVNKLSNWGIFEYQKHLLWELSDLEKAKDFTSIIGDIFNDISSINLLKELFLGEIENIESETETAWVKLTNIQNNDSISEPFHIKILMDSNIKVEIDISFLFIIYQSNIGDYTHRLEPIF